MATTFSKRRYTGRAAGARRDHGPAHDTSDGSEDRDGDLNQWTGNLKSFAAAGASEKNAPRRTRRAAGRELDRYRTQWRTSIGSNS
jgi:hypothetical protein